MNTYSKEPRTDSRETSPISPPHPPSDSSLLTPHSSLSSPFSLLPIALTVLILDQLTKLLVVHLLPLYHTKVIIPGFFNLVHVRNTGAAFSFLAGDTSLWRQFFFIAMSSIAIGVIFYIHKQVREDDRWQRRSLGLILGGAFGNLADRIRIGEVIDFVDFYAGSYHWPAFNVADSAITVGSFILIYTLFRSR